MNALDRLQVHVVIKVQVVQAGVESAPFEGVCAMEGGLPRSEMPPKMRHKPATTRGKAALLFGWYLVLGKTVFPRYGQRGTS